MCALTVEFYVGRAPSMRRVPQEWLAIISQYGGDIRETYGVPVEKIVEGIKYGVREVNIDTDLRLASTGAVRRLMATNPSEFDPRKFFGANVTAMRDACIARYEVFGNAGNASKIKPISSQAMYPRYALSCAAEKPVERRI